MAGQEITPNYEYKDENSFQDFVQFILEYFEVQQKWEELQRFGMEHPMASLFLIVTMATCSVPVVLFSLFVIGSVIISVTGFLFVEGTIITIASLVFVGALLFGGLFAAGLSVFLIAAYHVFLYARNMLDKVNRQTASQPVNADGVATKPPAKTD